jgi:hypothetical protein
MTDEFGGVAVAEAPHTDEFGGVPASAHTDEFGGVPVVPFNGQPLKLDPYQQAQYDSLSSGRGRVDSGDNSSDMLRAIAADRGRQLPGMVAGLAMAPFDAAGKVVNAAAQDYGALVGGNPEGFGNVQALWNGGTMPADQTLADVAQNHPVAATVGKVAEGLTETAPMMLAGMPGGALGRLISLGFSADMIHGGGQAATALGEELGKNPADRDMDKVTGAVASLVQSGAFAPLAGKHGSNKQIATLELARNLMSEPKALPVDYSRPNAARVQPEAAPIAITPDLGAALQSALRGNQGENLLRSKAGELPAAPSAEATPTENVPPAMAPPAGPAEQSGLDILGKHSEFITELWNHGAAGGQMPERADVESELGTQLSDKEWQALQDHHAAGLEFQIKTILSKLPSDAAEHLAPILKKKLNGGELNENEQGAYDSFMRLVASGDAIDKAPGAGDTKSAGAGTITGSNVRQGTEMPAESGASPGPIQPPSKISKAVARSLDRPYDLIDHATDNIGKIDPTLIREANPNWKPVGAARKLFKVGGTPADAAATELNRLGAYKGDPGQVDQLGDALNSAAQGRKGDRSTASRENRQLNEEAKAADQFGQKVIQGKFPKAAKVETVPIAHLVEGDTFEVQGHKFTVQEMHTDEDGNLTHVQVKDGPKFGVQNLRGDEVIHFDKGSLETKGNAVDFLAGEDAKPDFSLAKPESVEEQKARLAAEAVKAEADLKLKTQNLKLAEGAASPLVGSVGDIGQGDLLGGGDLFSAGGKQPAEPVANKIAGMGGPVRQRPAKVTVPKEVAATPAPAAHPLRQYFADRLAGLRGIMAPQALGGGAREVANALRHFMGKNALAMARADEALKSFRKEFDKQSKEANYNVIDALERDPSQLPARYQELAQLFRKEFDWRIAEIQKYAPNALQHLIENYFPHIWKDPKRAASTMAQVSSRLFAGRKEFLKQRTIDFFKDGIEAGLEPISDNPVDLLMAKMHSMDKFLLALRAQSEFRASGAMKFKYLFERMPDGWQTMDDPSFIVQKPPVVDIKEAFDSFQRAKMGEILQDLGVSYKRVASLGGTRWAEADMGMKEIRAKIGAHEPTLWHELGHQADWKFPELRDALPVRGNSAVAVQLRKLADLRAEGQEVSDSHKKYLRATEEKMAELFRAYVHAPDLFKETAPDVLRVFEGFLNTQPKLRNNLLELRRGRLAMGDETTQVKLGGMQVLGHWIMPDGPAQVIGNYLSPGLARFSAYNSFRVASNLLNAAQLGMSGFHLGFTSLDAATSRLAVGIEDLAAGNVTRAAKTFASVPVSPVTNILQGRRMMQEALHPGTTDTETAALVKALEQGGGRIGQDRFWQTDFIRRMNKAFHEGTATGYLKGALLAPASAVEAAMKPIMEYVVPRQKLGVFADMARREMERLGPDASVEDTREAMRKAWDSVDNRMGQVVYDNLFYNRAVKDLALVTFRAYGWQLGKYREGFGAITDATKAAGAVVKGQRPELSHRMAYAMALPLMVGTIGGVMTYLMTGQRPQDYKDYFMPRTGETDPRGNPVRLNLPSYMKDVLAYAKHPITSVEHSLNPMFSAISDLLNNKDFYDVRIRNPDDPLWQQGSEVAQFAAKQFIPFTFTGTMKLREDAAPLWKQVFPFFGVTPAPARMTMTPAQELSAEITSASMSGAPRTKEQYDKSKLIKDIVTDFKRGQPDSARAKMAQGFQSHQLNENSVHQIIDRQIYNPLQFQVLHMDVPAAMRVWRVSNPEERAKLQPMILQKVWNSKTLAPEQIAATIQEIQRATTTATTGH